MALTEAQTASTDSSTLEGNSNTRKETSMSVSAIAHDMEKWWGCMKLIKNLNSSPELSL